jgi:hypothetical protein
MLLLAAIFVRPATHLLINQRQTSQGARDRALSATAKFVSELQIIFLNAQVVDFEK